MFPVLLLLALGIVACEAFGHPNVTPQHRHAGLFANTISPRGGDRSGETAVADDGEHVSELKFYTLEGGMCPYAARTWMCLLELGFPFDTIEISGMNKPDWYMKINPRGKVPAIQNTADGSVVYESAICDEYLSDLARSAAGGGPPAGAAAWKLMPVAPSERAAMRLLNDRVDSELGPAMFTYLMNGDSDRDGELRAALEVGLAALEDALVDGGGPYLMGEDFTIADVHVLPFFLRLRVSLGHFKGYEVPAERFPKLLEWFELCSERESVKAASPPDEKIIELYNRFKEVDYGFGGLNRNVD